MAILAALSVNIANRGKGKRAEPKDFMPVFGPKRRMTPDDMLAMAETLNAAYGGLDLRKDRKGTQ